MSYTLHITGSKADAIALRPRMRQQGSHRSHPAWSVEAPR